MTSRGHSLNLKSGFLALLGLSAFAIAHPLMDRLGYGSTFFVTHGAEAPDILAFAITIYVLPAALLIAAVGCVQILSNAAAKLLISIFAGMLASLWTMGIASVLPAIFAIAIAIVFGSVMGRCYFIFPRLREVLQILGLISPVIVVFFLAFTPIKNLILPERGFEGDAIARSKTPIVFLLFDELSLAAITTPDGEIDAGRLPNFARLERISTWYRNTTTVSTMTHRAVPSILSGMRSTEDSQPVIREFPKNLFTLLGASHAINASEVYTRLCPTKFCPKSGSAAQIEFNGLAMYQDVWIFWLHSVLPAELAGKHLPSISNRWSNFSREDEEVPSGSLPPPALLALLDLSKDESVLFRKFISSLQEITGATVYYFHLALPHHPWIRLPDGTKYNGIGTPGKLTSFYGWSDDQYLVDEVVLRYSLQVEYVDFLLGQALDVLDQSDHFSEVMLIITSDHGIAFAPGKPARTPDESTLADVARVPLFIKYPGQLSGVRDDRRIETIDIFPTIANVMGLPLSEATDGQSLIADNWKQEVRHVLEAGNNFPDFEREMDMSVASERIYRVLQPGKSALDAIGLSLGRRYLGKPAPLSASMDTKFLLRLNDPNVYEDVDLDSGFLPARMTGTLEGSSLGTEIMVALNGTFAGSGMTYDESGSVSIMLDPRRFRSGENDIRAYVIDASEILEINVDIDFGSWSIRRNEAGKVTVTDKQGTSYQLDDTLKGRATFSASAQNLTGYACDESLRLAPKAVLLIEHDEVTTTNFTMTEKPFFSKDEGIAALKCWFSFKESIDLRQRDIAILALFEGGRMVEIHPKKMNYLFFERGGLFSVF